MRLSVSSFACEFVSLCVRLFDYQWACFCWVNSEKDVILIIVHVKIIEKTLEVIFYRVYRHLRTANISSSSMMTAATAAAKAPGIRLMPSMTIVATPQLRGSGLNRCVIT